MSNGTNGTMAEDSGKYEGFKRQVREAIRELAPMEADPYREIRFSNTLYLHVMSYPDKAGSIELMAIVPYDHNGEYDTDASQLNEIPNTEDFYQAVMEALNAVTTSEHSEIPFQLTQQVDDGTWERDANTYETFEIEVELAD